MGQDPWHVADELFIFSGIYGCSSHFIPFHPQISGNMWKNISFDHPTKALTPSDSFQGPRTQRGFFDPCGRPLSSAGLQAPHLVDEKRLSHLKRQYLNFPFIYIKLSIYNLYLIIYMYVCMYLCIYLFIIYLFMYIICMCNVYIYIYIYILTYIHIMHIYIYGYGIYGILHRDRDT